MSQGFAYTNTVSISSSALPSGAATESTLSALNGKLPSLGQALAAASVPVVLTAAQLTTLTPPAAITGFATSAKQDTGNTSLASIDGKITACNTGAVVVASSALPAGAATEATLDARTGSLTETAPATDTASSGLNGRLQRIAQRLTSLLALIPSALTGSGNFKVAMQESNASQAVTGTFWQATQPVSLASVPSHAVTNAGTFATQAAQSGTWNVTNISGTVSLPTGAATESSLLDLDNKFSSAAAHTDNQSGPVTTDVWAFGMYFDGSAWDRVRGDSTDGLLVNLGANNDVTVTNTVTVASHAVTNAGTFAVQATVAAGATNIAKAEDVASADADVGVPAMAVRKATPANTSGTDGDYEFLQMSAGRLWCSATIDAALPAGTNAIGKLAANTGVTIGAVEIAAAQTLATVTTVTNLSQMGGVAITLNKGASDTGTQRVTLGDGTQTIGALTANQSVNTAQIAGTTTATGNGAATSGTQRVALADISAGDYETVAASQTDQAMGATGAAGDYLAGVLIVPATTSPGAVSIKDGSGSAITVFTGGASSVSNLVPFFVPLGIISASGAWKLTTGANVSAIGVGNFT